MSLKVLITGANSAFDLLLLRTIACVGSMTLIVASASAATPANGLWRTPEDDGRVEVSDEGGNIAGRLVGSARLDADPYLLDQNNADTSRRSRALKDLFLFSDLTGHSPIWKGKMYSPTDGKTYSATVTLLNADTLKVTGCIVFPLCRSQTWMRIH